MRMVFGRWEAVGNFSGLEEAKYANRKEWGIMASYNNVLRYNCTAEGLKDAEVVSVVMRSFL
jgi:hypothetical protein